MAYNSSTGVISGNVTVDDVRQALGTSATNVIALCQHPNINKYSRYKPYAFGGIRPNGLYGKDPVPSGDAEKIIRDNNFGMEPTAITFPANNTSTTGIITTWKQWRAPNGLRAVNSPTGIDEPYRLGDFSGYDSNALPYVEEYEIFGDIGKDFFYPIRNGMMGVRITINSKTGTSILPSEFNWNSVEFEDMRLTLIVANLDKLGRYLFVQSQRGILDAAIESFWNTATKKGSLEVRMDLTGADQADINTFLNGGTNLFMAVGFAQEIDINSNSNWDLLTDVGNATYINTKVSSRQLPFDLINIDMWNKGWKVVGVYGGFAINANREARFNLPCHLVVNPDNTQCSYNTSSKIISISFGGSKFTIQPTFGSATLTTGATNADITDFKVGGRLGLMFDVEISKGGNVLSETKYAVLAPSLNETGSSSTGDNRVITIGSGGTTFSPTFSYGRDMAESAVRDFYGAENIPSNGVIQIPYDGQQGRVDVKMNCSIICFPYRDTTHYVYAVPVAQLSNTIIEKLLINTSVGSN